MHVNSGVDDQQNIDGVPLFSYGKAAANKFEKLGIDPAKDFRSLRKLYPNYSALKIALTRKNLFLNGVVKKQIKNLYDSTRSLNKSVKNIGSPAIIKQNDSPENDTIKIMTLNTASNQSIAPEFDQRPQQQSTNVIVANQVIEAEQKLINGPRTSTVLPQDLKIASRGQPIYDTNSLVNESNRFDDTLLPSNQVFPSAATNMGRDEIIGEAISLAEDQPTLIDPRNGMEQSQRASFSEDSRLKPVKGGMRRDFNPNNEQTAIKEDVDRQLWMEYLPSLQEADYLTSKIRDNRDEEVMNKQWRHWNYKGHQIDFQNPLEIDHLHQKALMYYGVDKTSPLPRVFRGGSINEGAKQYGSEIPRPFEKANNIITKDENLNAVLMDGNLNSRSFVNKEWVRRNINSAKSTLMKPHYGIHSYEPNRWITAYPPPSVQRTAEGQFRTDSGISSNLRNDLINAPMHVNNTNMPNLMKGYFIPQNPSLSSLGDVTKYLPKEKN
jgi:hypothetical protein